MDRASRLEVADSYARSGRLLPADVETIETDVLSGRVRYVRPDGSSYPAPDVEETPLVPYFDVPGSYVGRHRANDPDALPADVLSLLDIAVAATRLRDARRAARDAATRLGEAFRQPGE